MAVGLLPGQLLLLPYAGISKNSVVGSRGSDVLACSSGCSCWMGTLSMASSSTKALVSSFSLISPSQSSPSSSPSSFCEFVGYNSQVWGVRGLARAVCLQRKLWASGQRRQENRGNDARGNDGRMARLKPSATKDTRSERDSVVRTTSRSQLRSSKAEEELKNEAEVEEEKEQTVSANNRLSRKGDSEVISSALKSDHLSGPTAEDVEEEGDDGLGGGAALGTVVAGLGLVAVLGGFGALGFIYREQINAILIQFSDFIEGYGPAGYGLFVLVYAVLELVAIPAIPLTMSAGLLFGTAIGTVLVSIAGTIAATGAFLVARYLARDRILSMAKNNKKFMAIDRAIGEDGFRVVTLLRLSPLLPFSLGNYLYGLTSVKLGPYVLGSWVGMLPGTWAYVSAGAIGRKLIQSESEQLWTGAPEQLWTLGLGLAATVFAATYVTRIAKEALKEIDE